jgi:NAD(P)-dependent dehydrogenase (short-subunit alcohol dehydrogenase family)
MGGGSRVTIVTGMTKGIGKAIAFIFARAGISVVGIARNQKEVDEVLRCTFNLARPQYYLWGL